jgi:multidrug efflux system outer membrane protein
MRRFYTIASAALLLVFPGCFGLNSSRPEAEHDFELPDSWRAANAGTLGKIDNDWLNSFKDHELEKLVDQAIARNPDLQEAAARLKIAKQGAIIGRAGRFPSIGFSGSGSRTQRYQTITATPESPASTTASGNAAAAATIAEITPVTASRIARDSNYGLTLDASWEIDLWGRLRDLDHAAHADYVAAQADFGAARLSLAANTAKAWFDLITAGQQVKLAKETLDSYERNYRIIERNYKAGDETASPLDVQFGRTNVAAAERAVVQRGLAREESARTLEVLIGDYPSSALKGRDELPKLGREIPSGLPSGLLERRPDLVAAEADVLASAKRAGAARKSLLPSFALTGRASTSSQRLSDMLLDPEAIVWNAASSVAQTVFDGGAPTAQARQSLAQNEASIRRYASLVLQALREVESALATEHSLAAQEEFLAVELRQASLAETQAARDYSQGIVGILEVLEAQRRAVSARNSMIMLRNQRLQNRVDLHLALGGGFEGKS